MKVNWQEIGSVLSIVFWVAVIGVFALYIGNNVYTSNKVTCSNSSIPYEVIEYNDDTRLNTEQKQVTTYGINGTKKVCAKGNGTVVSNTIVAQPLNQRVSVPTKVPEPVRIPVVNYTEDYSECPITTCNDGTCSSSTGRGTCSWHGGVASYNF